MRLEGLSAVAVILIVGGVAVLVGGLFTLKGAIILWALNLLGWAKVPVSLLNAFVVGLAASVLFGGMSVRLRGDTVVTLPKLRT